MIVGITGNYCSGKDSASLIFADHGYSIIDVDKIGYEALEVKKDEIISAFGGEVVLDGLIDRKKLGEIVFKKSEEKKKLEAIAHPWMIRRVKTLSERDKNTVINAALLVEMCLFVLCDFVLGIEIDEEIAVTRGIKRDHLSREEVVGRWRAQIPLKEKLYYVDKIIDNNGGIDDFKEKIAGVIKQIVKVAQYK